MAGDINHGSVLAITTKKFHIVSYILFILNFKVTTSYKVSEIFII